MYSQYDPNQGGYGYQPGWDNSYQMGGYPPAFNGHPNQMHAPMPMAPGPGPDHVMFEQRHPLPVYENQFGYQGRPGPGPVPGPGPNQYQINLNQPTFPEFTGPGLSGVPPPPQISRPPLAGNFVAQQTNPAATYKPEPAIHDQRSQFRIFEDVVTFICDEYGFVGPDIFFSTSHVRGHIKPMEGDLVLVEAERVDGMKFQYAAKRVQVVKVKAQLELEKKILGKVSLPEEYDDGAPKASLRNAPPPPVLSKPSGSSKRRSRSASRDSKGNRSFRERSRSSSYDKHRHSGSRSRSRSRDANIHRRRGSRSTSRSKKSIPYRKSPHKESSKGRPDKKLEQSTKATASPFSEFLQSITNVNDVSRNPGYLVSDQAVKGQNNKQKKADFIDYNVWGLPEVCEVNKKQLGSDARNSGMWISGSAFPPTPQNQATANTSSKSKQISIKLGYTGNKESIKKSHPPSHTKNSHEVSAKSKQDLFNHQKTNADKSLSKGHKSEKDSRNSKSGNSRDERRIAAERERVDFENRVKKLKQKEMEFEERLKEVERSHRRSSSPTPPRSGKKLNKPSPPEYVKKLVKKFSEEEKISASLHKQSRRTSPMVRLVISSQDMDSMSIERRENRKSTPTEDEIDEIKRNIKLRERQLENESRLLKEKEATLGSLEKEFMTTSLSPPLIRLDSRSPSPDPRRGRRSGRSRSRSPRPSRNEKAVRYLKKDSPPRRRHSRSRSRSPRNVAVGESYRGRPLTREAPVARRRDDTISPNPAPVAIDRPSKDPTLVLRLGRFLRNGENFICYVCNKKGHHGTVCWMRKPGITYPEDESSF